MKRLQGIFRQVYPKHTGQAGRIHVVCKGSFLMVTSVELACSDTDFLHVFGRVSSHLDSIKWYLNIFVLCSLSLWKVPLILVPWEGNWTSKSGMHPSGSGQKGVTSFLTPSLLAEQALCDICRVWGNNQEPGTQQFWGCSLLWWCPVEWPHALLFSSVWCIFPASSHSIQGVRLPPGELLQHWNQPKERFNPCHQNKTLCVCFFTLRNCQD